MLDKDNTLNFAATREDENVYDMIVKQAKDIVIAGESSIDLQGKIVLSIAMRLKAEQFMIEKLIECDGNDETVEKIRNDGKPQTGMLLKAFKGKLSTLTEAIACLDKVLLMSSENIHINSFMFEPLIDMSVDSLIRIYTRLSTYTSD